MNKRIILELAARYGINTHIDILELFATEIYGDGVKAGVEKEANTALRDYFAASAMQGLMSVYAKDYANSISEKLLADWSYEQADAMLKAKGVDDE